MRSPTAGGAFCRVPVEDEVRWRRSERSGPASGFATGVGGRGPTRAGRVSPSSNCPTFQTFPRLQVVPAERGQEVAGRQESSRGTRHCDHTRVDCDAFERVFALTPSRLGIRVREMINVAVLRERSQWKIPPTLSRSDRGIQRAEVHLPREGRLGDQTQHDVGFLAEQVVFPP